MNAVVKPVELTDLHPSRDDLLGDVLSGLSATPKRLPSKYFYDRRGSELFEEITRQPEYYLTRVELALLQARGTEIADAVGPQAHVVELGSGSGRKTRLLLEALKEPVAYTPVEISRSALVDSVQRLDREFGPVQMLPVLGDFTQPIPLPDPERSARRVLVFFPGSTLGNFTESEAVRLLRAMRETMGRTGAALIGIDLQKSPDLIHAAYNDAAGITAAFTLNLLERLNRELGANFDLNAFRHRAVYRAEAGRIETFIESLRNQVITLQGRTFAFSANEIMQVEYSHKYTDEGFRALASRAGLSVTHAWNDPKDWFALRLLQPA